MAVPEALRRRTAGVAVFTSTRHADAATAAKIVRLAAEKSTA